MKEEFDYLRSFTKGIFTMFEEKIIVAQGEIISTNMVTNYLVEQGYNAMLIPALEFMRTDKNAEPDLEYIREKIKVQLDENPGKEIYITQGFICRNAYGEVDNLQRGGSDSQYASKFGKLSSGHRTAKGQFSFQCQRKAMWMQIFMVCLLYRKA